MPPVRTTKRSASPADPSPSYTSPYTFDETPSSASVVRLDSYPFPAQESDSPVKKKRSHGKARPPGHIPRPPNAFIIFRTDYIKSMATHSTPEVSKNLGAMWKKMNPLEKRPWVEKAEEAKAEHKKLHPGYKYKPVHPRDSEGRCIRKPRKPNQPRVKYTPDDVLDNFSTSYQWIEKTEVEFPNTSFASDSSSVSSPPRSPSPAPEAFFSQTQPMYQTYRRSSSVPPPRADDRFFFGMTPESGSMYPHSPSGHHTGHMSRRLSKRPSTSMDFACAGPGPLNPELYSANNGMEYLSAGEPSQWRPGHRRSISAPGYGLGGDYMAQFAQPLNHNFASEANPLTPINPVFGNVFDKFSWNTPSNAQHAPPAYENEMPPYITLNIPSMTHSPTSNISSATSPPASTPIGVSPSRTPAIHHPAPVPPFDINAFQAQISEFDAVASRPFDQMAQEGLDNALGLIPRFAPYARSGDASRVQGNDDPHHSAGNIEGTFAPVADIRSYEDAHYTQPDMVPSRPLDFNELIVEGY